MKLRRSEGDVLKSILTFLRTAGIPAWRQSTGAARIGNRFLRFGTPGMSDIIGILPGGRFLAIEVKNGRNRLTERQRMFLQLISEYGGVAMVARSVEDVVKNLSKKEVFNVIFQQDTVGQVRGNRPRSAGRVLSLQAD